MSGIPAQTHHRRPPVRGLRAGIPQKCCSPRCSEPQRSCASAPRRSAAPVLRPHANCGPDPAIRREVDRAARRKRMSPSCRCGVGPPSAAESSSKTRGWRRKLRSSAIPSGPETAREPRRGAWLVSASWSSSCQCEAPRLANVARREAEKILDYEVDRSEKSTCDSGDVECGGDLCWLG